MANPTLIVLYKWVARNGPAHAIDRFRMKLLPFFLREGVAFEEVGLATEVSPEFIEAAKLAAADIVGKPFPKLEGV